MKFIRNWLRPERPSGVALHPSRTFDLASAPPAVFERCIAGIEQVLGGHVSDANAREGRIEATFGLVNSERLTVAIEKLDDARTRVTIESRRGAIGDRPRSSTYVDALASYLQTEVIR